MDLKRQRRLVAVFLALAMVVAAVVCYLYKQPPEGKRVFGVTYMTVNNPFYKVIDNELLKAIEKRGDRLITLDPALEVEKQNAQIYYFIEQGVSGIFVNPIDFQHSEPALVAAQEAGIPVVVIDAPVEQSQLVDCTIVSDNYNAGVLCAQTMMERLDQANIILLKHTTAKSAKDRIQGFVDTIQGHPAYRIINEGECEGQLELAMPIMQQLLAETPWVNVVMALNDPSAMGAMAALEAGGREDVLVYGVDGTPDFKSMLGVNSMAAGTVAQSPVTMGRLAARSMYDILAGQQVEHEVIIPVTMVSADNVEPGTQKRWQ